jgi:monoterpene epsilon-lactone hydrolase
MDVTRIPAAPDDRDAAFAVLTGLGDRDLTLPADASTLAALLDLTPEEKPAGVVTVSAVTDLSLGSPSIDTNAPTDAGVNREMLTFLVGQYLADAPADRAPQSPIFGDLSTLPPLLMIAGGAEALLDDTLRFAEKATAAGVKTQVDVYEAMPHAFTLVALDDDNPTGRMLRDRQTRWIDAS